jgi:hypothetical protein
MSDTTERTDSEYHALDGTTGLYHEAQADGVPYDEDIEPFTRELPSNPQR